MTRKIIDRTGVWPEIHPGNQHRMREFIRSWLVPVAIVVAVWRGLSELLVRARELAASGELALRLEARRLQQVSDALARARTREPARVRVGAGTDSRSCASGLLGPGPDLRSHAAVRVGAVRDRDIDDVGLLEGAMRRAASERMDVAASGVRRRAVRRARRAAAQDDPHLAAELLSAAPRPVSAEAAEAVGPAPREAIPAPRRPPAPARRRRATAADAPPAPAVAGAPRRDGGWTDWRWLAADADDAGDRPLTATWPLFTVLCGALLTFAPLVRPLAEPAPWLAVAGLALVLAGWIGARRS